MANQSPVRDTASSATFVDELHLIPRWSVAAAVFAFVGMQYFFWEVIPNHHHPIGLRLYFAISWSLLAALYMLMIGYITRDTPRRGMTTWQWVVICVVLPTGIGAVLYFLLRQPLISLCPACGTHVESEYHFCPQCAYQVSAACGRCYRSVSITDLYCVYCGHDLASDNRPARLHAFSD
ncbi:zinc ribbon domain-containing protein [Acidipila rosea]|uniref:Phospholipase D-like protein n=1 Tax=Acidipila rosea TaxID=768535 RepID=A0A4R1L9U7_9BACT|nr:zinc ribbon domain-containing protein [Acidipila rosea]MBW4045963.1 zinc ribbon domain-containing protein [Acidobacteriota bacterium]TCK75148.1 phospholipase D-like protein [Acidipila rosea]